MALLQKLRERLGRLGRKDADRLSDQEDSKRHADDMERKAFKSSYPAARPPDPPGTTPGL